MWSFEASAIFGALAVAVAFGLYSCVKWWRFRRATPDQFMSEIVQYSRDGIVVHDINGRILWANESWCNLFDRTINEVRFKNPRSFVMPPNERPSATELENFRFDLESDIFNSYEIVRNCRKDGTEVWVSLSFTHHVLPSGEDRVVAFVRDITEEIESQQELKRSHALIAYRADHDALTDTANRSKLDKFLDKTREEAERNNTRFGLLHIDLDHFKTINDTFGHAAGDQVIQTVARRMQNLLGPNDLLARIGGDEFVIVRPNTLEFDPLMALARMLIQRVGEPIDWEDKALYVGASIGASLSTAEHADTNTMMQKADIALYAAKSKGRGRAACYDSAMNRDHIDRTRLSAELSNALTSGQLEVFLQPQYSMIARQTTGFEALIRWQHPTRGLLRPREFLGVAHEIGLIRQIDRFAATQALAACHSLSEAGHRGLNISLNLSPETMACEDFPEFLREEARKYDLQPSNITVEVLETTLLLNAETDPERNIRNLSHAGFRVELDDFGTGYAGLSNLGRLRVDGVKIDQSMITDLANDITNQIIVQAIVSLSSDLGMRVVAEGVSSPEIAQILREFGCTSLQGSAIGPAMCLERAKEWLECTDMDNILLPQSGLEPPRRLALI